MPNSLHLLHYQIKLLRSYLEDPKAQVDACRDPKLRSGAFVDIPIERASEVDDFLLDTGHWRKLAAQPLGFSGHFAFYNEVSDFNVADAFV